MIDGNMNHMMAQSDDDDDDDDDNDDDDLLPPLGFSYANSVKASSDFERKAKLNKTMTEINNNELCKIMIENADIGVSNNSSNADLAAPRSYKLQNSISMLINKNDDQNDLEMMLSPANNNSLKVISHTDIAPVTLPIDTIDEGEPIDNNYNNTSNKNEDVYKSRPTKVILNLDEEGFDAIQKQHQQIEYLQRSGYPRKHKAAIGSIAHLSPVLQESLSIIPCEDFFKPFSHITLAETLKLDLSMKRYFDLPISKNQTHDIAATNNNNNNKNGSYNNNNSININNNQNKIEEQITTNKHSSSNSNSNLNSNNSNKNENINLKKMQSTYMSRTASSIHQLNSTYALTSSYANEQVAILPKLELQEIIDPKSQHVHSHHRHHLPSAPHSFRFSVSHSPRNGLLSINAAQPSLLHELKSSAHDNNHQHHHHHHHQINGHISSTNNSNNSSLHNEDLISPRLKQLKFLQEHGNNSRKNRKKAQNNRNGAQTLQQFLHNAMNLGDKTHRYIYIAPFGDDDHHYCSSTFEGLNSHNEYLNSRVPYHYVVEFVQAVVHPIPVKVLPLQNLDGLTIRRQAVNSNLRLSQVNIPQLCSRAADLLPPDGMFLLALLLDLDLGPSDSCNTFWGSVFPENGIALCSFGRCFSYVYGDIFASSTSHSKYGNNSSNMTMESVKMLSKVGIVDDINSSIVGSKLELITNNNNTNNNHENTNENNINKSNNKPLASNSSRSSKTSTVPTNSQVSRNQSKFDHMINLHDSSDMNGNYAEDSSDNRYGMLLRRSVIGASQSVLLMMGFEYCDYYFCLMNNIGNSIALLDRCELFLCPVCLRKLHEAVILSNARQTGLENSFPIYTTKEKRMMAKKNGNIATTGYNLSHSTPMSFSQIPSLVWPEIEGIKVIQRYSRHYECLRKWGSYYLSDAAWLVHMITNLQRKAH